MGKQRHKRGTLGATRTVPTPTMPPPTPFWRVVTLPTLAAVALVASVWFYTRPPETPKVPVTRPPVQDLRAAWVPTTKDDLLVDAFRNARNESAKSADYLTAEPVFNEQPVSEAEGEAMQAGYILHRVRSIVSVRPGEPGKVTAWLDTPSRYTLATRVEGSAPKVSIKVGDRVEAPANLFIIDPDIVVEVRHGKIRALRAEMHRE